jgi:hypothetical protein
MKTLYINEIKCRRYDESSSMRCPLLIWFLKDICRESEWQHHI